MYVILVSGQTTSFLESSTSSPKVGILHISQLIILRYVFFFSCKLLQKVYRRWGLSINPVAGQQNAGAFSDILDTVKFRKLSPGLIFFRRPFWGAYFWKGLSTEGNLRFKIDWASLIVGSKFTVFCFVLLCIWGQFSQYKPPPPGGLSFGGAI